MESRIEIDQYDQNLNHYFDQPWLKCSIFAIYALKITTLDIEQKNNIISEHICWGST